MIAAWLRRHGDRLADDLALALAGPDACPDCFGEGVATVSLPDGNETVELCTSCGGSGKRERP